VKKIESIIRPHLLEAVGTALHRVGVCDLIVTEVRGLGRQKGNGEPRWNRSGHATGDFLPKVKIEGLVPDHLVDAAIDAVLIVAKTGRYGDGKVFVYGLETAHETEQAEERGEPAA
jgi:nitrogen regulatory protein P-II 1